MEEIIAPVDVNLIKSELTQNKKLGNTNKANNELYIITSHDSPNTMREIGRLREISYREAGASSGKSMDIDEYDTMEHPYSQLIVWDPQANKIIGGYRFILGKDIQLKADGQPRITSSHLYHFSDDFINNYLPHVMELGRSFVTPEYQSSRVGAKSIFTMDNLWDGIMYVILQHPNIMYLFGKMTIYPSYNKAARNLIIHFLNKHFHDNDKLIRPYNEIEIFDNPEIMNLILSEEDLKADYRLLKKAILQLGTFIPPLINSYINTASNMRMLGSCINDELGDAIETGIMIGINDIYGDKKERHTDAFIKNKIEDIKSRFPLIGQSLEITLQKHLERKRMRSFRNFQRKISGERSPMDFI